MSFLASLSLLIHFKNLSNQVQNYYFYITAIQPSLCEIFYKQLALYFYLCKNLPQSLILSILKNRNFIGKDSQRYPVRSGTWQ